ncbi:MAG: hypothetical protein IPL86_19170 [Flavobacteriales bacterium]|nr:hypothetical protein [Flavobacteriales bacterium]
MGIQVTPQGIMVVLTIVSALVMLWINRSSITAVVGAVVAKVTPPEVGTFPGGILPTQWETTEPHILDVMKILSELNQHDELGISHQLTEIYTILTEGEQRREVAEPPDVFDLMKQITRTMESDGIDCQSELQAIYAKIVTRKPEVTA